ncbi:MAG: ribosome-associated translation inhibitor RaiA [Bacteroidaceae bacterium]|jgi:putative sigma-54 modulation protein|nr:ribosome-associated translation inhibitor RaiA [Bacteroidaceae bacterium]
MEIRVQSIHFNATEKLQDYIHKKVSKLEKANDIVKIDVILKVVKPETAMNKEVGMNAHVAGAELRAEKVCDTFEEGVDLCCDSLARQLQKIKEKNAK